jgi:hypothetical protein
MCKYIYNVLIYQLLNVLFDEFVSGLRQTQNKYFIFYFIKNK